MWLYQSNARTDSNKQDFFEHHILDLFTLVAPSGHWGFFRQKNSYEYRTKQGKIPLADASALMSKNKLIFDIN